MRQGLKHQAPQPPATCPRLKTQRAKLRSAIAKGDAAATQGRAVRDDRAQIDKAAKKGVIHDNAAARYKSRLARRVNAADRATADAPVLRRRARRHGGQQGAIAAPPPA